MFKNTSILLVLLLFSVSLVAQKKEKDKILHKKTFFIEVTIAGGKKMKVFSEELSFSSGKIKFKQLGMEEHFLQGDYDVTKVDSSGDAWSVEFKASCKNDNEEYLIIKGIAFGEVIDGTITWETKKHKVKNEMTFTGNQKMKGDKFLPMEKTVNTSGNDKSSGSKSTKSKKSDSNLDDDILNDDLE